MQYMLPARPRPVAVVAITAALCAALAGAVPGLLHEAAPQSPSAPPPQGEGARAHARHGRDLLPHASLNGAIYFGQGHQAQAEEVAALLLMLVAKAQSGAHPAVSPANTVRRACEMATPHPAPGSPVTTAVKADPEHCGS